MPDKHKRNADKEEYGILEKMLIWLKSHSSNSCIINIDM